MRHLRARPISPEEIAPQEEALAEGIGLCYAFAARQDGGGCRPLRQWPLDRFVTPESFVGVKKTGKGRRKLGRKKRRMRSKIRHRKG
jgi:hypothetical protein